MVFLREFTDRRPTRPSISVDFRFVVCQLVCQNPPAIFVRDTPATTHESMTVNNSEARQGAPTKHLTVWWATSRLGCRVVCPSIVRTASLARYVDQTSGRFQAHCRPPRAGTFSSRMRKKLIRLVIGPQRSSLSSGASFEISPVPKPLPVIAN